MRKRNFRIVPYLWFLAKNHKKIIAGGLFLFSLAAPVCAWEFTKTLSLGYIKESNLTMEENDPWLVKDGATETGLNLGLEKEVKPGRRWVFSLELNNRDQQSFSAYDWFSYRLRASFRRKLGLGMLAPWWRFQVGTGKTRYQNESSHSRNTTNLHVEVGKRLNPRTTLTGNVGYDQTIGTQTDVLNLKGIFGNIRGSYSLDSRWSITGSYKYRRGDVVIHSWEEYDDMPSVYMEGWGTLNGEGKGMYKVSKAVSNIWSLGLSRSIGKDATWSFNLEQCKTAKSSLSYSNLVSKTQLNINF